MSAICLNCETPLQGKFCHVCGQKANTHRITFTKFVEHDLLHGILHLEKGILYTLKSLIVSPAFAVRSFISGKRVMHYNIFALFIIVAAIKSFIDANSAADVVIVSKVPNPADVTANAILDNYYKIFYLLSIPFFSFCTFIFFKKLNYNFTEHIVLNCFLLTGGFVYSTLFSLIGLFYKNEFIPVFGFGAVLVYVTSGMYRLTARHYSGSGFLWRISCILILFSIIFIFAFMLFIGVLYGNRFEAEFKLQ